jgi:hypothetical protein
VARHGECVVNRARPPVADETPVNAEAFYDYLHCLSEAVLLAESGDNLGAETYRLPASAAALMAFPVGTEESRAAGIILKAAERVSAEVTP